MALKYTLCLLVILSITCINANLVRFDSLNTTTTLRKSQHLKELAASVTDNTPNTNGTASATVPPSTSLISGLFSIIFAPVQLIFNGLYNVFTLITRGLLSIGNFAIRGLFSVVQLFFSIIWNLLGSIVKLVLPIIQPIFAFGWNALLGTIRLLLTPIRTIVTTIVSNFFDNYIAQLTAFINTIEPVGFLPSLIAHGVNMVVKQLISLLLFMKQSALTLVDIIFLNRFTKAEVDNLLCASEFTHEFAGTGPVKSYDSNQLASNNPIEDTRSEASCLLTTGVLVGIFDGHAGGACAQVIAKRLFHYITACLLPPDLLTKYLDSVKKLQPLELIEAYNDKVQFVEDVRDLYKNSFSLFLEDLFKDSRRGGFEMHKALEKAFLRLDDDLSKEALPESPSATVNMKTLSVAMSGAVGCVAHIDGPHLHVANVGDCNAVLGMLNDSNSWIVKKLTTEHNSYNQAEVDRILKEHPHNESNTVIRMERLLGQLAPLRALGDFRYKWSKEIMTNIVVKHFGEQMLAPNYYTPPYLTAKPDITYHRLTPRDKFLVIASDGLWDIVSPLQVVRLVGEHMSGKVTLSPLKLPRKDMKLSEINEMLLQRKKGLKMKPKDRNAATHLIRNALGGTEYGIDNGKLSQLLSLPAEVSRVFRDDITITVIYFDSEFIRQCPA